ncbi:hypothetical protein [Streptomyces sp. 184]|uniref:hypothetical protein n=1 Tax=Streptomyces sp. 184 TaxID=1827526 RepID=UPI0038924DEE
MVAPVLGGVLTAVTLVGCGDSGENGSDEGKDADSRANDPAQVVQAANRKTTEAETAKLQVASQAEAQGESVTVKGDGVIDLASGASDMTLAAQGQEIEQRVLDGVLFQKPPSGQRPQMLPSGKTWMKIDLAAIAAQQGGNGQVGDPATSFGFSEVVSGKDVRKVGSETVDGAETTHYKTRVDLKALAEAGGDPQTEKMTEQLGDSLPMDLWLDDEGRIRQQQFELTIEPEAGDGTGTEGVTSTTTLKFSDFGTDVDVRAPAAKDTADVTDKITDQQTMQGG